MGIDYVQLNGVAGGTGGTEPTPAFLPSVVSNGRVTLNWSGNGNLEWAPSVLGPCTPVTPASAKPYSENVLSAQNRFYRLRKP